MNVFYYDIAKWTLAICTEANDAARIPHLLPQYRDFRVKDANADDVLATVTLVTNDLLPQGQELGQFDCGGANHGVWRDEDGNYSFAISSPEGVLCCRLFATSDFKVSKVALYGNDEQQNFGLNNALMIVYAFATAPYETLLLHSSVVVKDERAYCFLGHSGTGKSTHSRLWMEALDGVELLNDDNPVLRIMDGEVWIFGSPWSGKTPCYRNLGYLLGAIVRLFQAPHNRIASEAKVAAFASLLPSCSTMMWDAPSYEKICQTVSKVVALRPFYRLDCLPDCEAALLCSRTVVS